MHYVANSGRSIQTTSEMKQRKEIFAQRDSFIRETNARTDIGYQVGHNFFSDMLPEETSAIFNKMPAEDLELSSEASGLKEN